MSVRDEINEYKPTLINMLQKLPCEEVYSMYMVYADDNDETIPMEMWYFKEYIDGCTSSQRKDFIYHNFNEKDEYFWIVDEEENGEQKSAFYSGSMKHFLYDFSILPVMIDWYLEDTDRLWWIEEKTPVLDTWKRKLEKLEVKLYKLEAKLYKLEAKIDE